MTLNVYMGRNLDLILDTQRPELGELDLILHRMLLTVIIIGISSLIRIIVCF